MIYFKFYRKSFTLFDVQFFKLVKSQRACNGSQVLVYPMGKCVFRVNSFRNASSFFKSQKVAVGVYYGIENPLPHVVSKTGVGRGGLVTYYNS